MTLRVIGAGWGRTGTLSTKVALERLGFGPCYHMIEVFRTHPEHRAQWRRAAAGEHVDWSGIFAGYEGAVDWPACAFWRELAEAYPEAKVLLTYRPAADWYESFDVTISNGIPREHPGEEDETGAMMNEVIVKRSFGGRAGSRDELIERYEEHVALVASQRSAPVGVLDGHCAEGGVGVCPGVEQRRLCVDDDPVEVQDQRLDHRNNMAGDSPGPDLAFRRSNLPVAGSRCALGAL